MTRAFALAREQRGRARGVRRASPQARSVPPPPRRSTWRTGGQPVTWPDPMRRAMIRRMPSPWRFVPLLAVVLVGCAPAAQQPTAAALSQCERDSLDTLYKGPDL